MLWIILELLIFRHFCLILDNTFLKQSYLSMLHSFIKSKYFQIFLSEKLTIYLWVCIFHISLLSTPSWDDILFQINVYFYLTVPLCIEHGYGVHRWKSNETTNNLTYNMLKSVASCGNYCNFSNHTRYCEIDTNITTILKCYVNELIILWTTGHIIEKKYQVTGHNLCTKHILGCPRTAFLRVCNGVIRSYGRISKKPSTQLH